MINELLRNILYYVEVAITKPLYAIVPAVVVLIAGGVLISSMPRSYQSDALMVMQFQQIPSALVSPTVSNDRLQFIEQRIMSRKNLLALAEKHSLFQELVNTLPTSQFASVIRRQITLDIQFTEAPDRSVTNGSVRIGFKYTKPEVAAAVVSDLVAQIVEESRRTRLARASETSRFLTQEVDNLNKRYQERDVVWNRYVEENKASHPGRVPALMVELQAKEQELTLLDRAIVSLNEDIRVYETQLRVGLERTGSVTRIANQLRALETEIATRSLTYSDAHPQLRALKQRQEELKVQLLAAQQAEPEETQRAVQSQDLPPDLRMIADRIAAAKPRLEQSAIQKNDLVQRINEIRAIVAKAPEVQAQITANETEKTTLQRTMNDMQSRLDAARIGERLEGGDAAPQIDVVEDPEIAKYPSGMRNAYLAVAVCFAAVGAGAVGIYMAHLFDRTIRGTFDLAGALAGETLVVVPLWAPKRHVAKTFREAMFSNPAPS